jgi:phospholipase C
VSCDGRTLYIVNGKSQTGPDPGTYQDSNNQYVLQLLKSGLLTAPTPDPEKVHELTRIAAHNNSYIMRPHLKDQFLMGELRKRIKHVIYIVKENRTYDQILGDLDRGNGDPSLTQFGVASWVVDPQLWIFH